LDFGICKLREVVGAPLLAAFARSGDFAFPGRKRKKQQKTARGAPFNPSFGLSGAFDHFEKFIQGSTAWANRGRAGLQACFKTR
jgi:hypothetical protein